MSGMLGKYLDQNKFVQEHAAAHIGEGNAHHDDEGADLDLIVRSGRLRFGSVVECIPYNPGPKLRGPVHRDSGVGRLAAHGPRAARGRGQEPCFE